MEVEPVAIAIFGVFISNYAGEKTRRVHPRYGPENDDEVVARRWAGSAPLVKQEFRDYAKAAIAVMETA